MKINKEKLVKAIKEKYYINYVTPYEHVKFKVAREIVKLIEEFEEEQKGVVYYTRTVNDRDFYISRCPYCDCCLDANRNDKYCSNCGGKLDWE